MTSRIEAATSVALSLALDAAEMRQKAIATNIANANTVGYVRQTTNFEQVIGALKTSWRDGQGLVGPLHGQPAMRIYPAPADATGEQGVQLDREMVDMAQNAVQYQTLLKGLERHYAILSMAISDGKK
jgi:flagellar basal-body rod protein FlgB